MNTRNIPNEFLVELEDRLSCPITAQIFLDAVSLPCGHSFEASAINKALALKKHCPECLQAANPKLIKPNYRLRDVIESLLKAFPELREKQFFSEAYLLNTIKQNEVTSVINQIKAHPHLLYAEIEDLKTPLHAAVAHGRLKVVKALIQNFSYLDINSQTKDGLTPLSYALVADLRDQEKIVSYLLDKGADPNILDENGLTALMRAAQAGLNDIILILINSKKQLYAHYFAGSGVNALILAAQHCNSQAFQAILALPHVHPNASLTGETALHAAARRGDAEIVAALIQHPEINIAASYRGKNALKLASEAGHADVVAQFLTQPAVRLWALHYCERGALKKTADTLIELYQAHGATPVVDLLGQIKQKATFVFYQDICRLVIKPLWQRLIENGQQNLLFTLLKADAKAINETYDGWNILQYCLSVNKTELAKQFVLSFKDVIKINNLCTYPPAALVSATALHVATLMRHDDLVGFLLAQGANSRLKTDTGMTAMAFAISVSSFESIKLLFEHDADYFLQQTNLVADETYLTLGVRHVQGEIFSWLASKFAHQANLANKVGETPVSLALSLHDQSKLLDLLVLPGIQLGDNDQTLLTPFIKLAKQNKDRTIANLFQYIAIVKAMLNPHYQKSKLNLDCIKAINGEQQSFLLMHFFQQGYAKSQIKLIFSFLNRLKNDTSIHSQNAFYFFNNKTDLNEEIGLLNNLFILAHDNFFNAHENWEKKIRREAFKLFQASLRDLGPEAELKRLLWARKQPVFRNLRYWFTHLRPQTIVDIDRRIETLQAEIKPSKQSIIHANP